MAIANVLSLEYIQFALGGITLTGLSFDFPYSLDLDISHLNGHMDSATLQLDYQLPI